MERIIENYPGNKSVKGLYHLIINNFPPHENFYELTAGSAFISQIKSPAKKTFVNDIDVDVYCKLLAYTQEHPELKWHVTNENLINILSTLVNGRIGSPADLIYIDLPYLGVKPQYKNGHDQHTHEQVLMLVAQLKTNVMLSHYEHPLYDNLITRNGWRKKVLRLHYHQKFVTEAIYMNYAEPKKLQDYSLLGKNRTDRQRIKKKIDRKSVV